MTGFPSSIAAYWDRVFGELPVTDRGSVLCAISEDISVRRAVMMLTTSDGHSRAVLRPEVADRAGIADASLLPLEEVVELLRAAGVVLHDPDYLFYLPTDAPSRIDATHHVRQLTEADRSAFDIFYGSASEQDHEDAFVELDHWAVFGCFDGGRLVSAASLCLWEGGAIADLGVLTLSDARGRGHARDVVRSIASFARHQGLEPQYRCQTDNHASVALAKASGLSLVGTWIVAMENSEIPAS